MATVPRAEWPIVAGDDEDFEWEFVDGDGAPINVTDREFSLQVRQWRGQTGEPLAVATCVVGGIDGNLVLISLSAVQTGLLGAVGTSVAADLQQVVGGKSSTVVKIDMPVDRDVTRED